jgi:hypothetical protein
MSWQLAVGSWQLAVGSWQLAVGSWQLAVGSWQLAVGSWQLAVGSWQCNRVFKVEMIDEYQNVRVPLSQISPLPTHNSQLITHNW